MSGVLFYFFIGVMAMLVYALCCFIKLHVYLLWTFQYMYLKHFKKVNNNNEGSMGILVGWPYTADK